MRSIKRLSSSENDPAECRGDRHIGAWEMLLCDQLPPVLKEFPRRVPNARLFLRSMNCFDIRRALCSGALDLGLLYEDFGGFGDNLISYPCGTHPLVRVAAPEIAKAYPGFVTPNRTIPAKNSS